MDEFKFVVQPLTGAQSSAIAVENETRHKAFVEQMKELERARKIAELEDELFNAEPVTIEVERRLAKSDSAKWKSDYERALADLDD